MLDFLRRLFTAVYDNTIGAVVRCAKNAYEGKVDKRDHTTVGRLVTYLGFFVLARYWPQGAAFVALFRMLMVMDIIGTLASIFQDTANSYAT